MTEKSKTLEFETKRMRLILSADGRVVSLRRLPDGEELVDPEEYCPFCTITQPRPYQNEVKLSHPNKRTTYPVEKIERDETDPNLLHITFAVVPAKADVRVTVTDSYLSFSSEGFSAFDNPSMGVPPVTEFRLLQIPVKEREHFGDWLNAMWDETDAVAVLGASPFLRIDNERRRNGRILYGESLADTGLEGHSVVLCVANGREDLLDCIARMERDFGLPDGVGSRRGAWMRNSTLFTAEATPENIDRIIAYAKAGGFRQLLFYFPCFFREEKWYTRCGEYAYNEHYPHGAKDVSALLKKVTDAGLIPGFHVLQTHIGMNTSYVTPHADPRLRLTKYFTLAAPLPATDDGKPFDLPVLQSPAGCYLVENARILKFGAELISYESFTTEPPYRFLGCRRGDHGTEPIAHPAGEIGGQLDISEFGQQSCYIDQDTDLQDEVADKIAAVYNLGFRFLYLDGSEGAAPPYEVHVSNAQYRVWKKCSPAPLFCEGAAKSHFDWHFFGGGNAFDVFRPDIFKEKIIEHPHTEAGEVISDLTRVDFGWWRFFGKETQPDHFEFGSCRAVSWNCPFTLQLHLDDVGKNARAADIFEVMRRWSDVNARGLLTEEQKTEIRNHPKQEYHLIPDGRDGYDLIPYREYRGTAGGDRTIRLFLFDWKGKTWAVYWNAYGDGKMRLPIAGGVRLFDLPIGEEIPAETEAGKLVLPTGRVRYLCADLPTDQFLSALDRAELC